MMSYAMTFKANTVQPLHAFWYNHNVRYRQKQVCNETCALRPCSRVTCWGGGMQIHRVAESNTYLPLCLEAGTTQPHPYALS